VTKWVAKVKIFSNQHYKNWQKTTNQIFKRLEQFMNNKERIGKKHPTCIREIWKQHYKVFRIWEL